MSVSELLQQTEPLSRVELFISCRKLADTDLTSKSDPIAVVYAESKGGQLTEAGRTEWIKDNLNPDFVKSVRVNYYFEHTQRLVVRVYDVDKPSTASLQKQDFIGEVHTTLADVVTARGGAYTGVLTKPGKSKKRGQIIIRNEEVQSVNEELQVDLYAKKIDNKDFFGKSDAYLVLSRQTQSGAFVPVAKTEVIRNNLNPDWKLLTASVQKLCNGDYERKLRCEVFDWDKDGSSDFIGAFEFTLNEWVVEEKKEFQLINPKKKKKGGVAGTIFIRSLQVVKKHSFLEYIHGGTELSLSVAIDFTQSNKDPSHPSSLHYMGTGTNQYVEAIRAVGGILTHYDTTKSYPVYGFGGKLPDGTISHCFPCSLTAQPEVSGVDGILAAYQNAIQRCKLWGPTNFAEIIKRVSTAAHFSKQHGSQTYNVLLILTDGVITDFKATVDQIVHASSAPMSIIIIGVGNANFDMMDDLDADDNALRDSRGRVAQRDIVQFVPFNQFKADTDTLTRAVLGELPAQLVGYMKGQGILPKPAAQFDLSAPMASMSLAPGTMPAVPGAGPVAPPTLGAPAMARPPSYNTAMGAPPPAFGGPPPAGGAAFGGMPPPAAGAPPPTYSQAGAGAPPPTYSQANVPGDVPAANQFN